MSRVDWIPVDLLSSMVVQLATASNGDAGKLNVYHAVNPQGIDWSALVPAVAKRLGKSVKLVSWAEWVELLRDSARAGSTAASLKQNPALKLVDYFESEAKAAARGEKWPVLQTKETVKKSQTMAELQPVSEAWMGQWMDQWGF